MDIIQVIKKLIFRPEIHIIMANFFLSISGFVFWSIMYRTVNISVVGKSANILAIGMAIGFWARLGADQALLKLRGKNISLKSEAWLKVIILSFSIIVVGSVLINVFSSIPLLIVPILSFLLFLNVIIDALFLSFNKTLQILLKGFLVSTLRIIFLILFEINTAEIAVIVWAFPLLIILSIFVILYKKIQADVEKSQSEVGIVKFYKESIFVFFVSSIGAIPTQFLPTIINEGLGEDILGEFQVVWLVIQTILTATFAFRDVLLGNPEGIDLKTRLSQSLILQIVILIGAIIVNYFIAPYVVLIITGQFNQSIITIYRLFITLTLPLTIITTFQGFFYSNNSYKAMIFLNIIIATTFLSIFLISSFIIQDIILLGIYWLSAAVILAIGLTLFVFKYHLKKIQ